MAHYSIHSTSVLGVYIEFNSIGGDVFVNLIAMQIAHIISAFVSGYINFRFTLIKTLKTLYLINVVCFFPFTFIS